MNFDMTFCTFWADCKNGHKCHRALTPRVRKMASGMPMPLSLFLYKPDCYEPTRLPDQRA